MPDFLKDSLFEHDKIQHLWGGFVLPSFILWFLVEITDIFLDIGPNGIKIPGHGFSWKDMAASFAGVAITKGIAIVTGISLWIVTLVMFISFLIVLLDISTSKRIER